jgi:hypothetical protein
MNMNAISRCAMAAAFAMVLLLAAAPACLAGSASGGVAKVNQSGSGYHGYSTYVPTMKVLVPGPDYSTSYWAPDLALTWHPGE